MIVKLSISFSYEVDEIQHAQSRARAALLDLFPGTFNPDVALTIEGDRSGANYLAPINEKHYKHGKVPLNDIFKGIK